jgi:hypothetical protein
VVTAGVSVPVGASSLLVGEPPEGIGDEHVLRRARMFPQDPDGKFDEALPETAAIDQLEDLRAAGAAYLMVPGTAFGWLEERHGLSGHLRNRFRLTADDEACRVYDLHNSRIESLLSALLEPDEAVMALLRDGASLALGTRLVWTVGSIPTMADAEAAGVRFLIVPDEAPWSPEDENILQAVERRYRKIAIRPGVCEMFELSDA